MDNKTKHDTPNNNNGSIIFKNPPTTNLQSIKSQISKNRCTFLFLTILLQLLIFFSSFPSLIRYQFDPPADQICPFGTVYVYDLPPVVNRDLVEHCDELDPWTSQCNATANNGFGLQARSLQSVLPQEIAPAWYWTDLYSLEIVYHHRILDYRCRTLVQDQVCVDQQFNAQFLFSNSHFYLHCFEREMIYEQ